MTHRERDAKRNIYVPLLFKPVTILCGLIVQRHLLLAFGSELIGAVSSIGTFLGYISLLEGGLGAVARAALYRPIAENDKEKIGSILYEITCFFRKVGFFLILYVLILAFSFKTISHVTALDALSSFLLVIAISISTFAQYFIGMSNTVLVNAEQKLYVSNLIDVFVTITNAVLVVVLTKLGCGFIMVQLVSSIVFVIRPFILAFYVRRCLDIVPIRNKERQLSDKWVGLGQHFAYFLHNHTDILVLTLFGELKAVSVYGVYSMIFGAISTTASSFFRGIEALFGNMYAKNETALLNKTFDMYETLISITSTILFGIATVMIVPFVRLYTAEINDANYIEPVFAIFLAVAGWLSCLRSPYHNMVIAAGHFKQTNIAAYGEAVINIATSVILVIHHGLVGVAIGTVAATAYRFVYYVFYISGHILYRSIWKCVKHTVVNFVVFAVIYFGSSRIDALLSCPTYYRWIVCSVLVGLLAAAVSILTNAIVFPAEFKDIMKKLNLHKKEL